MDAERTKNATIIKANGTAEAMEMARAVPGERSDADECNAALSDATVPGGADEP